MPGYDSQLDEMSDQQVLKDNMFIRRVLDNEELIQLFVVDQPKEEMTIRQIDTTDFRTTWLDRIKGCTR